VYKRERGEGYYFPQGDTPGPSVFLEASFRPVNSRIARVEGERSCGVNFKGRV
jgi:hypothetical protein